jgi:hypothetical protein
MIAVLGRSWEVRKKSDGRACGQRLRDVEKPVTVIGDFWYEEGRRRGEDRRRRSEQNPWTISFDEKAI